MATPAIPDPTIPAPTIEVRTIGREGQPLVVIDDFAPDLDLLRAAAAAARFGPAGQHYPGVRAGLPDGWLRGRMPLLASAIGRGFGRCRRLETIDAAFSIVTTPPAALSPRQRVPHVDAFGPERIALVLYLAADDAGGTAFYRHRATGYETVDHARAPAFFDRLAAEVGDGSPLPPGYIDGDTALFERIDAVEARANRAILYRSFLLHSGAIGADAALSADPLTGRLTVTGFFAIG